MHFLIATDGDESSERALQVGAQLSRTAASSVTILTVIGHEDDRPNAEAILTQALSVIAPAAKEVISKVNVGEVVDEIAREAEAEDYDLLIIGSRPVHGFLGRLLGPTSEKIMAHSPHPVLIAKGENRPIHKILLCSSGSYGYDSPSSTMARLQPIFPGTALTLLHVMSQISATPDTSQGWQLEADADELIAQNTPEGQFLEERAEFLQQAGFTVMAKVRHGLVVDEILQELLCGDYDLVVIGAHETTGWRRYLLDDVAHQIIIQADRSVLVV